ncbi:uncharacterized protein [Hoplias malabaricus]|uniref:uncharacterized protein n=1 Tax=Hoplias malabaricus TaxID=27720 RepID=UPI003462FD47
MFLRCWMVMEGVGILCLLVCATLQSANSEILQVSQTLGSIAILNCGTLTKGKVTWSRETDGQRVDILTTHNGETTKHISDPDRRYSSGANIVLSIIRVSQSDAGRYYCSGTTVELTVTPKTNATHPTPNQSTSTKANESSTAPTTAPTTQDLWIFIGVALGSCLAAAVSLVLFLWRCYSKREATSISQRNHGHIYDSINEIAPVTLSMATFNQNRENVSYTRQAPQFDDPIYYLATYPGVQITVSDF